MEFLEVPLIDDDLIKLLVRFVLNIFFLSLIVMFAIRPRLRDREFAFTAVMMNIMVFFICFALKKLDLGLGMALGLFAIFGVLRYRTDAIGVKEMTYLFVVIGIAVINSLSNKSTSYAEVASVNLLILFSAILKERMIIRGNGRSANSSELSTSVTEPGDDSVSNGNDFSSSPELTGKSKGAGKKGDSKADKLPKYTVDYDRLEWLGIQHREKLLADLCQRTGMNIVRVQVNHIDLLQKRAALVVWAGEMS